MVSRRVCLILSHRAVEVGKEQHSKSAPCAANWGCCRGRWDGNSCCWQAAHMASPLGVKMVTPVHTHAGLPGSTVGPLSPAADSATPGTGQQGGPQAPSSAPSAAGAGGAGAASAAGGPRELQEVIERVRAACPGMVIHGCSLQGTVGVAAKDAAEVRLAYPRVFCASIALAAPGRPEPLRVILQSTDRAAEADPWAGTTHHLFRRISSLAMRALAYYQRRAAYHCLTATAGAGAGAAAAAVNGAGPGAPPKAPTPGQGPQAGGAAGGAGPAGAGHGAGVAGASAGAVALEEVLLWLASYRDLFARPCLATGKLMAMEPSSQNPLPPLFRPFMWVVPAASSCVWLAFYVQLPGRAGGQYDAFFGHVQHVGFHNA